MRDTAFSVKVAIFLSRKVSCVCACANLNYLRATMTSCEPGRKRAYGEDLRWRIVWQREALGMKCKDVASNLGVDAATVSRIVTRFRETGLVLKKSHPSRRAFRKLTMGVEMTILHIVLRRPGIYLHEVARELNETLGAEVALSTICMFLKKCGFTRQKLRLSAIQRDSFLHLQFVSEVSLYDRDMMIFLDETGSDRRNSIRKYGYSIRGRPLVSEKLLVRGKRIPAIAFMSVNGMLDCKTVRGSVDGAIFYDFVQTSLIHQLMPFDGRNPHSVVILDNCSIHHMEETVRMIQEVGAIVHFLPPYSPDFNPIEEAFSKVKATLKLLDQEADMGEDPEDLVLSAFSSVTKEDCQSWIDHAHNF